MKLKIASIFGASAILLGAFGAHSLVEVLSESELASFKTGVFYHLIHALFLLVLAFIGSRHKVNLSFYLAFTGVVLFSGSIYLLALDALLEINLSFLWPVTPIGGLLLILAWLSLFNLVETSN